LKKTRKAQKKVKKNENILKLAAAGIQLTAVNCKPTVGIVS